MLKDTAIIVITFVGILSIIGIGYFFCKIMINTLKSHNENKDK